MLSRVKKNYSATGGYGGAADLLYEARLQPKIA